MSQRALPIALADHAVFESFYAAGNEALVAWLASLAEGGQRSGCWLWGAAASGKTHLLQAVAERFGDDSVYVPLALLAEAGPAVVDNLAERGCVCIDDADRIAGKPVFELAMFELCNQLLDRGGLLVAAAARAPREAGFELPDLASRFSRLPVFHVEPLDEDGRIAALQLRARHRGLDLPADTARFMLSRHRRDMASLYGLLDRLDAAALEAKRRLTVPFVRDILRAIER